jgi:hypothetical protein
MVILRGLMELWVRRLFRSLSVEGVEVAERRVGVGIGIGRGMFFLMRLQLDL